MREGQKMSGTVLVVDDQRGARRALAAELEDAGFTVIEALDGQDGWDRFCRQRPDLVITDMVMPRSDGIDLVGRIRTRSETPVIVFTAYGTVETAVSAIKSGADEFVSSSDLSPEGLVELVRGTLKARPTRTGDRDLENILPGRSESIVRVRERIAGLAPLGTPVLVRGESGTGRATIARALHDIGSRAPGEFVRLGCGTFSPRNYRVPDRGTVYLEGAERLSASAQSFWAARLVTQERGRELDTARIVASTSEDLGALTSEGRYDTRLADALNRFEISVPPLRDRIEDIPQLAELLVGKIGRALRRNGMHLSSSAREFLKTERWPGNVEQLERVLEKAVAFSSSTEISKKSIEEVLGDLQESLASIRERRSAQDREELLKAIHETGGNISQTANMLGRSRSAVYRLIARHGIRLTRPY
jgi:DNA-binding NtrC family response regulator